MESITIGQMAAALAIIVALIAGVQTLKKSLKTSLESLLRDKFAEIERSLNDIKAAQREAKAQLDDVDLENCKNYLVTFIAEVRRGEMKDETETQRFWEEYEHYQKKGGNSYIRHSVEDLQAKHLM